MTDRPCRVLMVYPTVRAELVLGLHREACELVGARYPAAPLGLITVAALLPPDWDVRLVNRNTEELARRRSRLGRHGDDRRHAAPAARLAAHHRAVPQRGQAGRGRRARRHLAARTSTRRPTSRCSARPKSVIEDFVAAWEAGAAHGRVRGAEKFQVDVTKTPIPRFDLLKFDQYLYIGVQFSRGCPFTCEFCDIIELYGRVPRTKTNEQMLAELDALYELGYRGHVDFVDDNLIGNKKAREGLPARTSKTWLEAHDYPFEFSTEASLNLADDDELLRLMKEANFFAVFVGIESPDTETLMQMRKKQNTRRNIAESIHKIYAHGMFVTAGFIVGFDSEKGSIADAMIELHRGHARSRSPWSACSMRCPSTQLTRRLDQGRPPACRPRHCKSPATATNAPPGSISTRCGRARGVCRTTARARARLRPGRLCRPAEAAVDACSTVPRERREPPAGDIKLRAGALATVHRIINRLPEVREIFWETFTECASKQSQFGALPGADDGDLPASSARSRARSSTTSTARSPACTISRRRGAWPSHEPAAAAM